MKKRSKSRRKKTLKGKKEVVIHETTRISMEPVLEIRKPATLSQTLTEPAVAVVKPKTRTRVNRQVPRRVA